MKKYIAILMLIMIAITGCSKAGQNQGSGGKNSSKDPLAYEKRVLLDMIDILERFGNLIAGAKTTDDVVKATNEFCDKLDVLNPEITHITTKYPEWGQNPPPQITDIIAKYLEVNRNFTTVTLPAMKTGFVDKYPEDKALMGVFDRLTKLLEKEFEYK